MATIAVRRLVCTKLSTSTFTASATPAAGATLRYSLCRFATTTTTNATDRLYTQKHDWISVTSKDKQIGRVGISKHAEEALGDVVYVQPPEVDTKYAQFDEVGAIESVKAASELVAPVSGSITQVNTKLEEKPSLVNSDCYGEGWLYEMKLQDPKELDKLMNEEQYKRFLEGQEQTGGL